MPINTITLVLLRLFALCWALRGIGQLAAHLFLSYGQGGMEMMLWNLMSPIVYLVFGVVTWIFAPAVSALVLRNRDANATLDGVTREDLYATGFISVGAYFALSSIGSTINWIHFVTMQGADTAFRDASERGSLYEFSESLITLLAGIVLVTTAHTWARKLTRS